MPRAPFNILVLPYRRTAVGTHHYAVFHRSTVEMWQFIAGGGEDDEAPLLAAMREASEEAGIIVGHRAWQKLDAIASLPRAAFPSAQWPGSVYVIPEYCFAVRIEGDIRLSSEHDRYEWLDYASARSRLTWDSNRVALWELHERLASENVVPVG